MNRKQRRDQEFGRVQKPNYFKANTRYLYNRDLQLMMKGKYLESNIKMVNEQTKEEVKDEIQISE